MKKILLSVLFVFAAFSLGAQTRIKMKKEGGIYTVPCSVNGLKLRFIFDTGASNVCISLSEVSFMLRNEYMDERDIIGVSSSQIADGSIVENTRVILREIEIGGIKLYNIEAVAMHNLSAPLLLGQSAIQKLGKIELNRDELVILNGKSDVFQENTHSFEEELPYDWVIMRENEDGTIYIDLKSIVRTGNHIKFWVRETNLPDKWKKELLYEKTYRYGRNEWKKVDTILCLWVVDCKEKQMAVLEEIIYTKEGDIIDSRSHNLEWSHIPPGTNFTHFVCD
jgi:clan AA aspartic protease (TIGR02281 family)